MISFDSIPEIYIAQGTTDLRKGIDQLAAVIQNQFDLSPFEDCLYVFCNRAHNRIKMLYWDGTGFWLLNKRLEKGTFQWDRKGDQCVSITHQQLKWLLEGLAMVQKRAFQTQYYAAV